MDERFIRTPSRWAQPGLILPQVLVERISELLPLLEEQANADYQSGRLRFRDLDELHDGVKLLLKLTSTKRS